MNRFFLPQASNSVTLRVELDNRPGMLAQLTQAIGGVGANIGDIEIVRSDGSVMTRDITVYALGGSLTPLLDSLRDVDGIRVVNVSDRTFLLHRGGKLSVQGKTPIRSREQLSMAYTPGVARVCTAIHENPDQVYELTSKGNMVAVVTDGTAILGLGDLGPEAALPVMEGKAQLFKEFAGVNAFPICLDTTDTDAIVETVVRIAPGFGGINLEDISAPRCFEIERRLKERLDIPVFHDDQHGTAVVTTAALINALRVVGKRAEDVKVVIMGVGAAGTAVGRMILDLGVTNLIGVDRQGALVRGRGDMSEDKQAFARDTNPDLIEGGIDEVIRGADVFIGLAGPNLITVDHLKQMAPDPIVFAMSNPDPEIAPEEAFEHVAVLATGRSDYPNQINNVLCFPGIFRGALACRATDITEGMKLAAAHAIAQAISDENLTAEFIIPSVFDKRVVKNVTQAVVDAARADGVARA
jgi:malate dehydrogenase (oxaloacetate-decarboxylating)